MKSIPLIGAGTFAKSAVVTAQRRLNCYLEALPDPDKGAFAVYGTPGLTPWLNLGAQPIRGAYVAGGYLWAVSGSTLYKVRADGNVTTIGTLNSNTTTVVMSDNGTQLMAVDGVNGYIVTMSSNAFVQITDVDFPNGAQWVSFNSGFFLVNNPNTGQFFKSASYDGTTWSATDFATAESFPDPVVAVWVDRGYVHLFGSQTIEYWQNAGGVGFPFAPLTGATQQWGLGAQFSLAKVAGGTMFLAANNQGQTQVMYLNGFVPQRVSTPDVENIINGFSTRSDAAALSYVVDGHAMYQLTFPTGGRTLLFDATEKLWHEVQTGVSATYARHQGQYGVKFNDSYIVSDYSNGNLYTLSPTTYTDNGTAILRQIQTKHVFNDYNVLGIDELYLDMETGVGLNSGQGSSPQIMVQVSKDNGRTFGNERWCSIGALGNYKVRAILRRFGVGRDFVFRISMTDPVKFTVAGSAIVPRMKQQ